MLEVREIPSGLDLRRTSLNISIEKEAENESVNTIEEETTKTVLRLGSKKINVKSFLSQTKNDQLINFLKMKEEQDTYLFSKLDLYIFYAARGISCVFLFTPLSNNTLTKYFIILCGLTCFANCYSGYLQMKLKSSH